MSPSRRPWLFALLGVTAALALAAAPAGAVVRDQGHYEGSESSTNNTCAPDFILEVESTFFGHALLRVDKRGQAFLVKDRFNFRDVLTNPDTGEFFVITGRALFHDIKATHLPDHEAGDDVYAFKSIEAGQAFTILDSDGNVVLRESGSIVFSIVFNTLGDGQPGGVVLDEEEPILHGQHEGFGDAFDFCALAAELTGVEED